jgi:hypothetical protein
VEFIGIAGHRGKPCRMSLLFGLKGEGARLMLCIFFLGVNRLQERNQATNVTPQKIRQESGAT